MKLQDALDYVDKNNLGMWVMRISKDNRYMFATRQDSHYLGKYLISANTNLRSGNYIAITKEEVEKYSDWQYNIASRIDIPNYIPKEQRDRYIKEKFNIKVREEKEHGKKSS